VIGQTNRPLSKAEALLPYDKRLRFYSGIDLAAGSLQVETKLRKVSGLMAMTHVFFSCVQETDEFVHLAGSFYKHTQLLKAANMQLKQMLRFFRLPLWRWNVFTRNS